jgi:hypothetical protein
MIRLSVIALFYLSSAMAHSWYSEDTPLVLRDDLPYHDHSFEKDLEELGYCIIPRLLSDAETEVLYQRVWHEYIEKAWPRCKMDDRSNWKESFPIQNQWAIFAGPAGQTQVMWDLRQDPRIVNIFRQIWCADSDELIVSMDGLSLICPPEIREGSVEPWPHVDQAVLRSSDIVHNNTPPPDFESESLMKTKPFTIQGQFLFEDSFDGDGGFYCIPGSHLRFDQFASHLQWLSEYNLSDDELIRARNEYLEEFFTYYQDSAGHPYQMKHVTAPRGSLILWDSRTLHWNQFPEKDRPPSDKPKVRMVGYLCYVPKERLTDEGSALRKKAFETGISTGHNPSYPELKPTRPQEKFKHYLEDKNYTQPRIHLTPLGESLLGF